MHLLTVFSHPLRNKYPSAVMDAFHQPIINDGHTIDLLDLHKEAFDPRFNEADHAAFWGQPISQEIKQMQARVNRADRLAFVFPVYWWSMPAMMKGWIERVFTEGWAYQYGNGVQDRGKKELAGKLTNKPTILIGIGGSKQTTYEKYGYERAMKTQIDVGIFSYCGITDVESHLIYDVEGPSKAGVREEGISFARSLGADFVSDTRTQRNAKEEHFSIPR